MNPKTLMLFAPSAYPLGGVATWADYLLPGLRSIGWNPTLALTQGRHHDPAAYLRIHPFTPVVTIDCGAGAQASRVRNAAAAIAKARPDIVAAVNLPDVALAVRRLRGLGAFAGRLAMVEHGINRETLLDMRKLSSVVDAFVGANRLTCALARRFAGLDPSRVFYAPCGVGSSRSPERPQTEHSSKLNLLYAGRLERDQKRIHELPVLADELRRLGVAFRLEIAGGGPEEAGLRRRFADSGHEVTFLGVVAQRELCERVLSQADALLILSAWETGPLVAYEAMAAGVPVVSSRFVGSGLEGALIEGDTCLMFPVGDMRAAAAAVARLCDPALGRRLSEAALALVSARYGREISVSRWDVVFRQILGLPKLPPTHSSESLKPSGRLDHWIGPEAGDLVRGAFGRAYRHGEPGGEWPHLLTRSDAETEAFHALLGACETGASP